MSTQARQAYSRSVDRERRFLQLLQHARREQARFLAERLRDNASTAFGTEHRFGALTTVDDFRAAVPIRDYDALEPWIERAVSGERGVLTKEDPLAFLRTSGTTSRSKKIPHTRTQGFYEVYAQWIAWGSLLRTHPELVERDDTTMNLAFDPVPHQAGAVPYLSSTQMTFEGAARDPMDGFPGSNAPWARPPADLENYEDRLYYRLRLALGSDLRSIMSINPSSLIALCHFLRQQWPRLVRDVADGTLLGARLGQPDPDRARALERLGPNVGPRDLWPNLSVLRCWTSASAAHYLPMLHERFGQEVDVWPYATIATEGAVGVPLIRTDRRPVLLIHAGFFEFVPVDREVQPGSVTLLFDEVEPGRDYHLIQTRANGLYRYDLGDTYRVLDTIDGVPCLEFIGRRGGFSSFTGEKLTEWQVVAATAAALRERALAAVNYVWFPRWADPPHYLCLIEPDRPWSDAAMEGLQAELDRQLGLHNDEYPSKRASARLGPVVVELARPGTFLRHWQRQVERGSAPTQVKDAPLQRNDDLLATLRADASADRGDA